MKRICEVCQSNHDVHLFVNTNQTVCRKHYSQLRLYGKILPRTIFDKNEYEIKEDSIGKYADLFLRNRKHEIVAKSQIDLLDLERTLELKWAYEKYWGYVRAKISGKYVFLQNFIIGVSGLIDHVDRKTLNNRRYNLIVSNKSLNSLNKGLVSNNTSDVTGVSYSQRTSSWRSYINWEGERIELGLFKLKKNAVIARLEKEKEFLGNLSPQKHLFKEYGL